MPLRIHDLPRGSGERILLVDDEEAVRRVTGRLLEHLGYRVLMSEAAEAALDLLRAEPIDLVLTDVVMPGMSGIELAERVRSEHPNQPILFTSGYNPRWYSEDSALSPEPMMPKPYSMAELANAVRSALAAESQAEAGRRTES